MADLTGMMQAAAGAAGGSLDVQEVFSTTLYTGTGAALPIVNGIDLDGEGGLVWSKNRNDTAQNKLYDSARGITFAIESDTTDANQTEVTGITSFNSNGYTYGADGNTNSNGATYVSWTFRKAEKFFDVVTYTGNGSDPRNIAHNLGSVPGSMILKCTSNTGGWFVYHRSLGNAQSLNLNEAGGGETGTAIWGTTTPTSTVFTVGNINANTSGRTYVIYLFAHDAGGFGANENAISCGNYTGNGSATGPTVTLGYEPQWLMIKRTGSNGNWVILDSKRDVSNPRDKFLVPNTSAAEATGNDVDFNATSFQLKTTSVTVNASGGTYIYIAIRADM